jgi:hypothetical protein
VVCRVLVSFVLHAFGRWLTRWESNAARVGKETSPDVGGDALGLGSRGGRQEVEMEKGEGTEVDRLRGTRVTCHLVTLQPEYPDSYLSLSFPPSSILSHYSLATPPSTPKSQTSPPTSGDVSLPTRAAFDSQRVSHRPNACNTNATNPVRTTTPARAALFPLLGPRRRQRRLAASLLRPRAMPGYEHARTQHGEAVSARACNAAYAGPPRQYVSPSSLLSRFPGANYDLWRHSTRHSGLASSHIASDPQHTRATRKGGRRLTRPSL